MSFPVPERNDPTPELTNHPNSSGSSSEPRSPSAEPSMPPPEVVPPAVRGSFRLCRLIGTDVFVHWSWFAAADILIRDRPVPFASLVWDVAEYVIGFGLVLLHVFGHVLTCLQVGRSADRVVLWPLGGLAFVAPRRGPRPPSGLQPPARW